MIKKLASAVIGTGMVLATVAPAFAVVNCVNLTTGPFSANLCNRFLNKLQTLNITNNGTVNHTQNFRTNTGNNTQNFNTSTQNLTTSNATVSITSQVGLNAADVTVNQTDPAEDQIGTNNITGPFSNNVVNITTNKTVNMTVRNSGNVTQNVTAKANTGNNSSSYNTIGGNLSTGPADIWSMITTVMNTVNITINQ